LGTTTRVPLVIGLAAVVVLAACGAPAASSPASASSTVPASVAAESAASSPSASVAPTAKASPKLASDYAVLQGTGDIARYAGSVYASDVEELAINVVLFLQPEGPAFSPTVINVGVGQHIKLTFHDLDAHDDEATPPHDFTIEALDLSVRIPKGGDASVELTMPLERGTLQFICRPHAANYKMAGEFRIN
jgi:plastocyanin